MYKNEQFESRTSQWRLLLIFKCSTLLSYQGPHFKFFFRHRKSEGLQLCCTFLSFCISPHWKCYVAEKRYNGEIKQCIIVIFIQSLLLLKYTLLNYTLVHFYISVTLPYTLLTQFLSLSSCRLNNFVKNKSLLQISPANLLNLYSF